MLRRTRRYFHTLRHLRLRQVAGRLVGASRRRRGVPQGPPPPEDLRGILPVCAPFPHHDPWNRPADVLKGRFRFLNRSTELGQPVDWQAGALPLLWRFHLHYFDYLYLLGPEGREALCREWVQCNPPGRGVGWHPYPTARRVVNWVRARLQPPDLQRSLYRQAAFLFRHLETHLGGNHLLENARALVMAGLFFEEQGEAPRWLARGLRLYRRETPRQVLPDGGHSERSPMYHALVLEGYLDVLNLLPAGHAARPRLEAAARRMLAFLQAMTHPDGGLALFNDATLEGAPRTDALLQYAQQVIGGGAPAARFRFEDTGYFVQDTSSFSLQAPQDTSRLSSGLKTRLASPSARSQDTSGLYLVIDGGPVGPDHLPAHVHADLFSFELSAGGLRFVVDSGVYEYTAGPMRDYVRSTPAHNTVSIDGRDQAECWSSFRVARRYRPRDVSFQQTGTSCRFSGRFEGYARLLGDGIVHRRTIRLRAHRRGSLRVEDVVTGNGIHQVHSHLHLHPGVEVEDAEGGLVLRREHVACTFETRAPVSVERGWYCPQFGVRRAHPVLVLGGTCALPVRLTYRLDFW